MLLYKYYAPKWRDIIASRMVRFTPLGAFNDPFEMNPVVRGLMPENELVDTVRPMVKEQLASAMQRLPEETRAKVQQALEQQFQGVDEHIRRQVMASQKNVAPDVFDQARRQVDHRIGVFSLSEDPANLLMWAHYAEDHKGFVLCLDSDNAFFQAGPVSQLVGLRKVEYVEERSKIYLDSLGNLEGFKKLFLSKSREWQHEREWRMLRPFVGAPHHTDEAGFGVHLLELPAQAIRKLILGCRATEALERAVTGTLSASSELAHVRLSRMKLDREEFRLVETVMSR